MSCFVVEAVVSLLKRCLSEVMGKRDWSRTMREAEGRWLTSMEKLKSFLPLQSRTSSGTHGVMLLVMPAITCGEALWFMPRYPRHRQVSETVAPRVMHIIIQTHKTRGRPMAETHDRAMAVPMAALASQSCLNLTQKTNRAWRCQEVVRLG